MGYIYSVLWFLTAAVLVGRFRKESAAIYVLSVYFVYLGSWWLIDELVPVDMLAGSYGWTLRIVSAVALLLALVVHFAFKPREEEEDDLEESDDSQATVDGHQ